MVLLIEGIGYKLWTPTREEDLVKQVKEHVKEIFGEDSIYFDLKQKLKSKAGIVSIPDGYVFTFGKDSRWYVVEVELSAHPLHEHIVTQVTKYIPGIERPESQKAIVGAVYDEINSNKVMRAWVESKVGPEIHKVISDIVSKAPELAIAIDEKTVELEEVSRALPTKPKVVEFKTFEREGIGLGVHAHLFEPISRPPPPEGVVFVSPSRPDGVKFLLDNKAWAYVKKPGRKIDYFALYASKPEQSITYYGRVKNVMPQEAHPKLASTDPEVTGRYVIELESIEKLDKPITFNQVGSIQGPRYTTLDKLLKAKTTKELWG